MVNVDDFGDIAEEHGVSAIPCVKIIKEGKILAGFVGLKDKDAVEAVISSAL